MPARSVVLMASVILAVSFLGGITFADESSTSGSLVGFAEARDIGMNAARSTGGGGSEASGCCDHDCDCSNDCCCERHCHWTGGVEATYLNPNFRREQGLVDGQTQTDPFSIVNLVDPGWTAAPRIWLGVENCDGWGARMRYWQLCANRTAFGITPEEDVLVDLSQNLDMYDIDCELTKRFDLGCWKLLGTFGGRYASLDRLLQFHVLDFPDTSAFVAIDGQTNAGGLTAAMELSRPIGCTGVEAFGTLRVSPLWGSTRIATHVRTNDDGDLDSEDNWERGSTDLTIWEAQVGLQCSKYLECCCGTVFARCGFEYQAWISSNEEVGSLLDTNLHGVAVAVGFTH